MLKNSGIAFRLAFLILTSSTLIFGGIFGYNYYFSRKIIEKDIMANAENLTLSAVNKIEAVVSAVEKIPENLAYFLEYTGCDGEETLKLLRSVVAGNSEIYGATIAFEPYSFNKDFLYYAPYFCKSGGEIKLSYLGNDSYRYFYWDWYQIPKELKRPVWSEPYYDEGGGNIIMSTYSVPFYKNTGGERKFAGVVTADMSLLWLQDIVSSIKIGKTGYAFLISRNGVFVTHPEKDVIMNETIFSLAEARKDPLLRKTGKNMISGNSGFVPFTSILTRKKCWMAYAGIPSTGWSLGALFPQNELTRDIRNLSRLVFVFGGIGFIFLFLVISLIAGSITRPLRNLARATRDIGKGNLDFKLLPVKTKDEVGDLSASFAYMRDALKKYIKELTETTKVKERIESELKIAHNIQMGIVPKAFPPFPSRKEFDIYATLVPAREVGGDFYDFFFVDEDRLCFVIGDVSGKGVPAAIFMAMAKALIKAAAGQVKNPGETLAIANRELSS